MTVARDAYTLLVSAFLFPLHERLKGHSTLRRLRELERSQWLSPETIAARQAERLREFLAAAGVRVPYFRDLFARHGFRPEALRGPGDLGDLPFLTKALIREHGAALVAADARGLRPTSTGGSTGEPLRFQVGAARVSSDVASRCRAYRWWGVDVGDPEVVLWGSHIELTRQDRVRAIRDRLFRSTLLSANQMTPERLDRYIAAIERVRPSWIFSHPSALSELARRTEERGRRLDRLGVRVVFLTAEQLYEHQRRRIERVFGCPVANGYGGRDAGFVAHECPEGGMHLTAEDVLVEIVGDDGTPTPTGTAGEIVVTHLRSGDFPFIRYRTGDVGVLHDAPCRCGRGLPLLRDIHGRADDLLLGLDGARVPGQVVVLVLRDLPGLRAFKVIQEERDLVRVLLVPEAGFPPDAERIVAAGLRAHLGAGLRVVLEPVGEIPREASGKYRTVVSRVGRSPTLEAERGGDAG
jgi:phenylacetate-CoA ligase